MVEDSGLADLVTATIEDGDITLESLGNCFSGNTFETTAPEDLETIAPCDGEGGGDFTKGAFDLIPLIADQAPAPPDDAWRTTPEPGEQDSMPDATTAPAERFEGPEAVDVDAIEVPEKPEDG